MKKTTHMKIVELVLKQNASTKEILEELELLEEYLRWKKLTQSEIEMKAAKLHFDMVAKLCDQRMMNH